MRARLLLLSILVSSMLLSALPAAAQDGGTPPTAVPLSDTCRDSVERMAALLDDLVTIPDHLLQENAVRSDDDFDPNAYFEALDHLSMAPGYTLDYVYAYEFLGGRPFLYARPGDQPRYPTMDDFVSADDGSGNGYRDDVVLDGTPESYLQYAILDVMAEQFYLAWHANYNDFRVVCDSAVVEDILNPDNVFGYPMSDEIIAQARQLDVKPVIAIEKDTVQVQIVVFTMWGGFVRLTYTLSPDFPRQVAIVEAETLVSYDSGVRF